MQVDYDRYSMIVEGKREFIRSGAMHYFRLPHPDLWKDRLFKLKAAGYNTVDLYFCWAYHSSSPGEYNFEGNRDVEALLQMVDDLGLYLIARPGPYINAEYSGGGLPGWLIANHDAILRNRLEDGKFVWSQPYMDAVSEWWHQIVPKFKDFPRLLMVQIENEYATLDMEPDYMQALYTMTRDLGVTVPLMHNDMYTMGLFEEIVDIYAFDNYPVTQFDTNWRSLDGVFSVLDNIETNLRPFCQTRPLMVAELQAGWFGTWKGYPYEQIVEHLGREHINIVTKSLIGQGLTVFNHYKAIGGTNWEYTGSTDTYTSYDFGAPISEAGINTERLYEAKALNLLLSSFDAAATLKIEEPPAPVSSPQHLYTVRQCVDPATGTPTGGVWYFLRNLQEQEALLTLGGDVPVHVRPHGAVMLPYNFPLACGYKLAHTSVEPLFQSSHRLILKCSRPADILLETGAPAAWEAKASSGDDAQLHCEKITDTQYRITCKALPPRGYEVATLGALTVCFLGQEWSDTAWLEEDGMLVMGPEERLPNGEYGVQIPEKDLLLLGPDGTFHKQQGQTAKPSPLDLPELKYWSCEHEAHELYSDKHFYPVSDDGADLDANRVYEGSAWYRFQFEGNQVSTLTVDARHIWAVFLNGEFLAEGLHWNTVHAPSEPTPEVISLDKSKLNADGANELVIFVDGLGHPKGFHDDARQPQGLLLLKLDEEDVTTSVQLSEGFSRWKAPIRELLGLLPESAPVVRLETRFTLPSTEGLDAPMGLFLNNLDYERVNIYLNGVLIGRHWRQCQRQRLYYLPHGILKSHTQGENVLELIAMNFNPLISLKTCHPGLNDVYLQPYQVFTKITR
jgi:hypothetical protein